MQTKQEKQAQIDRIMKLQELAKKDKRDYTDEDRVHVQALINKVAGGF